MYKLVIKLAGLDKLDKKRFIETARKEFEEYATTRISRFPNFLVVESLEFHPHNIRRVFENLEIPFWSKCIYNADTHYEAPAWEIFSEISGKYRQISDPSISSDYDQEFEDEALYYPQCANTQVLCEPTY